MYYLLYYFNFKNPSKGKKINEKIIPTKLGIIDIALKGISEEKKALFKEILGNIVENINLHNNVDINDSKTE